MKIRFILDKCGHKNSLDEDIASESARCLKIFDEPYYVGLMSSNIHASCVTSESSFSDTMRNQLNFLFPSDRKSVV